MNTATIAISAKELNSFLRAVLNAACRVIATPAAIRNQPAYGRVATPTRQPATMIGNELRSPRFQMRAPPKATRPSARNIGDSLCRRLEKKIPLGSKASTQAAITAARGAGQLVDGRGEQDQPRDRDPHLGDAKDVVGRVERPELDREHELVQIVDDRGGPVRRRERRVRDRG